MPANYVLLEKITVGAAGASSVTFSGIPQTGYTDLVIKYSARSNDTDSTVSLYFNGVNTGTSYSMRNLFGTGSSVLSETFSSQAKMVRAGYKTQSNRTASTFSSSEIYIPNYAGSNYKSISVDATEENNATGSYMGFVAGLWSNTAAITSITLEHDTATTFAQYSTFYLYGVAKLGTTPAIAPYATGGDTIVTDGTYWIHTFNSSGIFTPQKSLSCDYLVVAGGGGGGATGVGGAGGGGAGGYRYFTGQSLASGTSYTATIGAGGVGSTVVANIGSSGGNSTFNSHTSAGGGGGAGDFGVNGAAGGSGGGANGAGGASHGGGAGNTPSTSPVQGYQGGQQVYDMNGGLGGGGSGGAGENSVNSGSFPGSRGWAGGVSTNNSITGTSVAYAGGGGGGMYDLGVPGVGGGAGAGSGGNSGGGAGYSASPANRGSGGGGASWSSGAPTYAGGSGSSGVIIIRYLI